MSLATVARVYETEHAIGALRNNHPIVLYEHGFSWDEKGEKELRDLLTESKTQIIGTDQEEDKKIVEEAGKFWFRFAPCGEPWQDTSDYSRIREAVREEAIREPVNNLLKEAFGYDCDLEFLTKNPHLKLLDGTRVGTIQKMLEFMQGEAIYPLHQMSLRIFSPPFETIRDEALYCISHREVASGSFVVVGEEVKGAVTLLSPSKRARGKWMKEIQERQRPFPLAPGHDFYIIDGTIVHLKEDKSSFYASRCTGDREIKYSLHVSTEKKEEFYSKLKGWIDRAMEKIEKVSFIELGS